MTIEEVQYIRKWMAVRLELEKRLKYCFTRLGDLFSQRKTLDEEWEAVDKLREQVVQIYEANMMDTVNALLGVDSEFLKIFPNPGPPAQPEKQSKKKEPENEQAD